MTTPAHTPDQPSSSSVVDALAALVGRDHVLTGFDDRRFYSQDICAAGVVPACVVRPGSVAEMAEAIKTATAAGLAVVPRGGGVSYTGGYHPDRESSVVVDTTRLDRVVEINAKDMYVVVECGCTWRTLWEALKPLGLRTPFWGPLSGSKATIGGSLSQHAILWGSVRYGGSPDVVLGVEVVTADGMIIKTGSAATHGVRPFYRHYGPDLTGMFLGDAGAFGVKARAVLKLMRQPAVVQTASFGFDTKEAMCAAMAEVAREGLVSECFGMDPGLQHQRMKRASLAKDLKALSGVVTSARSLTAGIKEAAKVAIAGRRFLDDVPYSLHLGSEGRDDASVSAAMKAVREIVAGLGGTEVENTIPKVMRGDPFVPMSSAIGPEGERWLPVHGLVPLSEAPAMWDAVLGLFAEYAERFERHGIVIGVLTAVVGSNAFVLEPVFYWPAPRTLFYDRMLDRDTVARFKNFPPNPEGEATVFEVRAKLTKLFLDRGATHLQIGRTYRYREGLQAEAWQVIESLKRAVDPAGLMNPGALGLK
jgi:FAD/FMN-containing dehydrogenase